MRKRILLITLLITVVGLLIFSLASTQVYYNSSLDGEKDNLKIYMNAFDPAKYQFDDGGADAFSQLLGGARVTVMDGEGNVLGESGTDKELGNHADRDEVKSARYGGEGFSVRNSSTLGQKLIYYCRKMTVDGSDYLIRIAVPTDSEWALFARALPTVAAYLALDVVACLLFTYIATYFILRPVEDLTREATLGGEVKSKYREFGTIVGVLNERNLNISRQMEEIRQEKELVEKTQNSKNEFIANITHEMNTPLTSIKGYAELLASGMLSDRQREDAYAVILGQSERLTNLITCIINYNEIDNDALPSYDVDLSKLTREMIGVVKPEADKRGVTVTERIQDNVIVCSRHERMAELVGNLLRNAIRYNKEGGSITVTLDFRHLSVADTGIGIAPENLDKVFSRFFTVDKSHGGKNGGFGLGLAVCKKICNRAGWRISVESEQGVGSTFTVDFA